ncbi:hypothetical protein N2152v2_006138 [Parachlorella kessleri]
MEPFLSATACMVGGSAPLLGAQMPQILGACLGTGHLLQSLRAAGSRRFQTSAARPAAPAVQEGIETVTVKVNSRPVTVAKDSSILTACEALGVGPACATPVWDGMEITTDSAKVKESVRGVLALMQANHPADCMTCDMNGRCEFQASRALGWLYGSCFRQNSSLPKEDLTARYNVKDMLPKLKEFSKEWEEDVQGHYQQYHDQSDAAITIDFEKCLKCGRCVSVCGLIQDMNVLGMQGRSRHRHPGVLTEAMDLSKCIECGQCSAICPVGAISERSEWREVLDQLESRRKTMIIMMAPSIRVAVGEELGLAPGAVTTGQIATAQRMLGFEYVFDANFSADLTIMEEGTELLKRLRKKWGLELPAEPAGEGHSHAHEEGPLPMFTSCCPAWINMVEKEYPELIPNLSSCKSPMAMMGAVVKHYMAAKLGKKPEDICLVGVMPCTAKKQEAERQEHRQEGEGQHVDYVITTREFGHMLRAKHIPLGSLEEGVFDDPLGQGSGAAVIFGNTGGVMEAALRTAYELAAGQPLPKLEVNAVRGLKGIKEATITFPDTAPQGVAGRELRVAVASGIGFARQLLDRMDKGEAQYDFVEVMSCPGGCVGGGGQPKTHDPLAVAKRAQAIYSIDERSTVRKSHENPSIQKLYAEFLGAPGSNLSHELLHTTYTDRSHRTFPAYSHHERQVDVADEATKSLPHHATTQKS